MAVVASSALVLAAAGSTGSAYGVRAPEAGARSGVVVKDIRLKVPGQKHRVSAFVVEPAGRLARHSAAGVLFLHWLGQIHNDNTEYLGEAVGLAQRGVVSVLPQGYFPWVPNPDGTTHDVTLVQHQVAAMERALNELADIPAVDPKRIAVVGHDYGAMYGSLLATATPRLGATAQDADSLWGTASRRMARLEGRPRRLLRAVRQPGPGRPHLTPRSARALPVGQ